MFNNAVQWLPYFIIGNLFGLKLSRLILDYQSKYIIVLTTLARVSSPDDSMGHMSKKMIESYERNMK